MVAFFSVVEFCFLIAYVTYRGRFFNSNGSTSSLYNISNYTNTYQPKHPMFKQLKITKDRNTLFRKKYK